MTDWILDREFYNKFRADARVLSLETLGYKTKIEKSSKGVKARVVETYKVYRSSTKILNNMR